MERALALLTDLPEPLVYGVLAAGAVIENILPVVPADTFIVAGGFIAGLGTVGPAGVFLVVWGFNVAGAVAVYAAGLKYGPGFFREGRGRALMAERQMRKLEAFYRRWGVLAVFAARFLPGFRALVPVFAGVAELGPARVIPPLVVASAIWYGALVRLGYLAGDNLDAVMETIDRTNRGLLAASALLGVVILGVWWRARRREASREDEDGDGT
ncbi:MAG: DedA family protein [Gemmatimonadetes bacterium]|nr:DedA family protein [Gemmatimonadota bacterium]